MRWLSPSIAASNRGGSCKSSAEPGVTGVKKKKQRPRRDVDPSFHRLLLLADESPEQRTGSLPGGNVEMWRKTVCLPYGASVLAIRPVNVACPLIKGYPHIKALSKEDRPDGEILESSVGAGSGAAWRAVIV